MDKKYQVFISSTYDDLAEARAKVRDAILKMVSLPGRNGIVRSSK